jgi:RNA-directed DNA polymerase
MRDHCDRMAPICSTISGLCYADDQIVGFPHRSDAERFLNDLSERLAAFALSLHLEKTRLIEFGRYAAERRAE